MFDFFDDQKKNPLMLLMNLMNAQDSQSGEGAEDKRAEPDPLALMKQAFEMHMQMVILAQQLCMLPMHFMQKLLEGLESGELTKGASEAKPGGFKLGNVEIPPKLLAWLMQLDMSPENLGKLQRVLDFLFEVLPQPKREQPEQEEPLHQILKEGQYGNPDGTMPFIRPTREGVK